MLKKKIVMILAAAMMTLSASSAFAAFADMELFRVVYERGTGTSEQLTDMGSITSLLSGTHNVAGDAITAGTASNLYVGYFALNRTTKEVWATSGSTNAPVMTGSVAFNTLTNGSTSMYTYYNSLTADANGVVTGIQSNTNSYRNKLSANSGRLGSALTTSSNIEASLASLVGATSGSVVQNLYYFANGSVAGAGQQIAGLTIATNFDGSSTVAATPTPIPAAFYLMGSGLMGLVGLRRRNKVA